jgi:hypothetical protein
MFFPGALSQIIAMVMFWVMVVGGGYLGTRLYLARAEVERLKVQIEEVRAESAACRDSQLELRASNDFLKHNMSILKQYFDRQRRGPIKIKDQEDIVRLFNGGSK